MFNLMDIFKKDIALKKIELKNATINLYINKNGFANYDVWKSEKKDTVSKSSTFNLDLEDVTLKNIIVNYIDKGNYLI